MKNYSQLFLVLFIAVSFVGCNSSSKPTGFVPRSFSPAVDAVGVDAYSPVTLRMNLSISEGSVQNTQAPVKALKDQYNSSQILRLVPAKDGKPSYEEVMDSDGSRVVLGDLIRKEAFAIVPLSENGTEIGQSSNSAYLANFQSVKSIDGLSIELVADKLNSSGEKVESLTVYTVPLSDPRSQQDTLSVTAVGGDQKISGSYEVFGSELTFTPDPENPLQWDTQYQVLVRNVLKAVDGKPLVADITTWQFTTGPQPPAGIRAVSHFGNQASPIDPIVVNFNFRPYANNAFQDSVKLFRISNTGVKTAVGVDFRVSASDLYVTPKALAGQSKGFLAYGSSFSLEISEGITGKSGTIENVVFSPENGLYTSAFNTPSPGLTNYGPLGSDVHPSPVKDVDFVDQKVVKIDLAFNFDILPSSANSNTIYLENLLNGSKVPVDINVNSLSPSQVAIYSRGPLDYGADYKVTVTKAVSSSLGGNINLASDFSWNFSTQSLQIVNRFPSPSSSSFGPGETGFVETNFDIAAGSYFEMSVIGENGIPQNLKGRADGDRRLVIPGVSTANLFHGSPGTVRLKLIAGNFTAFDDAYTFRTPENRVTITSRSPYPGEDDVDQDESIVITFSDAFGDLQAEDIEDYLVDLIEVDDCDLYPVIGDIIISGKQLTFTPDRDFSSFCEYEVRILGGVAIDSQGSESTAAYWTFTTDGLEVSTISADFRDSSINEVYIDTNFVLDFNQSIEAQSSFSLDDRVYITEGFSAFFGNRIEVDASIFGSELRVDILSDSFNGFANLEYGQTYTLVVEQDAVEGRYGGETMGGLWSYTFHVEEEPYTPDVTPDPSSFYVSSYGPTGSFVDTLDEIFLTFSDDLAGATFDIEVEKDGYLVFDVDTSVVGNTLYIYPEGIDDFLYENTTYTVSVFANSAGYQAASVTFSFTTDYEDFAAPNGASAIRRAKGQSGQAAPMTRKKAVAQSRVKTILSVGTLRDNGDVKVERAEK